jgi:hypothetical protein
MSQEPEDRPLLEEPRRSVESSKHSSAKRKTA